MKMLETPVDLPEYLRVAYTDMTNALADQFEKHGLTETEITMYLASHLVSMLPNIGATHVTAIMHTTLPVRVGLLDAHENSVELMDRISNSEDEDIEKYLDMLRKENKAPKSFSLPEIARKWLRLFMATNK